MRTTQTLKFVNLARLLQIIRYDPVQYMNLNKLSEFRFGNARQVEVKKNKIDLNQSQNIRESAVERSKQFNMSTNLFSILQRYTVAGSFLRELTEIIRKVNSKSELPPIRQQPSASNLGIKADASKQSLGLKKYQSPDIKTNYEKQTRMNAINPTPSGVISSPDPKKQDAI